MGETDRSPRQLVKVISDSGDALWITKIGERLENTLIFI